MQSRSRERISDDKQQQTFAKNLNKPSKSSYTREYSYNVDSESLQQPGQTDPRGLGFSYERQNQSATLPSNRSGPGVQKGTALAFTYNPKQSSTHDLSEQSKHQSSTETNPRRIGELKYGNARTAQKGTRVADGIEFPIQSRSKSPSESRAGIKQSNIDDNVEDFSGSREYVEGDYTKESIRLKTSALISGSNAANKPSATISSQQSHISPQVSLSNRGGLSAQNKVIDHESSYTSRHASRSSTPAKPLWDNDDSPLSNSAREPILSPAEAAEIERKYNELSRKKSDLSQDDTRRYQESTQAKPRANVKPYPTMVMITSLFDS